VYICESKCDDELYSFISLIDRFNTNFTVGGTFIGYRLDIRLPGLYTLSFRKNKGQDVMSRGVESNSNLS